MYELEYFASDQVLDVYNELMAGRVSWLQSINGLAETGVATPELQALIYSDACRPASYTEPTVTPAPAPRRNGFPVPHAG